MCWFTGLIFIKLFVEAHMVSQISSPKILHHQVQIFTVLKTWTRIYDEWTWQLIKELFLVHDTVDAFLGNHPILSQCILGFWHLLHGIDRGCSLIFDLPNPPEPPWSYLMQEFVVCACLGRWDLNFAFEGSGYFWCFLRRKNSLE